MQTYQDLKLLARDREQFLHLLSLIENKAKIFWQMFGFDFRRLKTEMPRTEKQLFNSLDSLFQKDKYIVKKAVNYLFTAFDNAIVKENLM